MRVQLLWIPVSWDGYGFFGLLWGDSIDGRRDYLRGIQFLCGAGVTGISIPEFLKISGILCEVPMEEQLQIAW